MPKRDDTQLFEEIKQYIALIGRGQKAGKTLTQAQAQHVMVKLLSGEALLEQTGAFLMLLRVREETSAELAGFLQACRDTLPASTKAFDKVDIDMGCYAGKRRHLPWFLLSAMLFADNDQRVFLHGFEETHSERLYLDSVFKALGWSVAKTCDEAQDHLATYGLCYMNLADLHPTMTSLLALRHTLGLRSCLHSLAKMLNPASAKVSLHGIFHRDLDTRHIEVAELINDTHVACIRGDSGEVEATPDKEFVMKMRGEIESIERHFPAQLTQWSQQTRSLSPTALKQVWTGELQSTYGEQAAITTAAVILSCQQNLSAEQALLEAKKRWQHRSRVWPEIV